MVRECKKLQGSEAIIKDAQKGRIDEERSSLAKNHNEFEYIDKLVLKAGEGLAEEYLNLAQNMSRELEKAESNVAYLKSTVDSLATLNEYT